jgi:hypothetical protein
VLVRFLTAIVSNLNSACVYDTTCEELKQDLNLILLVHELCTKSFGRGALCACSPCQEANRDIHRQYRTLARDTDTEQCALLPARTHHGNTLDIGNQTQNSHPSLPLYQFVL